MTSAQRLSPSAASTPHSLSSFLGGTSRRWLSHRSLRWSDWSRRRCAFAKAKNWMRGALRSSQTPPSAVIPLKFAVIATQVTPPTPVIPALSRDPVSSAPAIYPLRPSILTPGVTVGFVGIVRPKHRCGSTPIAPPTPVIPALSRDPVCSAPEICPPPLSILAQGSSPKVTHGMLGCRSKPRPRLRPLQAVGLAPVSTPPPVILGLDPRTHLATSRPNRHRAPMLTSEHSATPAPLRGEGPQRPQSPRTLPIARTTP
ncbi:hypothetical protein SAMN04487974_106182 [Pelagibacterium luteolum]|uniref:Uncharacterized protein n=1 Tax=Pelagibacterium luteolum TaxID=440168 RepID=A0A1G7WI67_9HYPH|nr:hypothetical protein SAMN04487974_106182 [Pelagibacterium luteolum]